MKSQALENKASGTKIATTNKVTVGKFYTPSQVTQVRKIMNKGIGIAARKYPNVTEGAIITAYAGLFMGACFGRAATLGGGNLLPSDVPVVAGSALLLAYGMNHFIKARLGSKYPDDKFYWINNKLILGAAACYVAGASMAVEAGAVAAAGFVVAASLFFSVGVHFSGAGQAIKNKTGYNPLKIFQIAGNHPNKFLGAAGISIMAAMAVAGSYLDLAGGALVFLQALKGGYVQGIPKAAQQNILKSVGKINAWLENPAYQGKPLHEVVKTENGRFKAIDEKAPNALKIANELNMAYKRITIYGNEKLLSNIVKDADKDNGVAAAICLLSGKNFSKEEAAVVASAKKEITDPKPKESLKAKGSFLKDILSGAGQKTNQPPMLAKA